MFLFFIASIILTFSNKISDIIFLQYVFIFYIIVNKVYQSSDISEKEAIADDDRVRESINIISERRQADN